MTRRLPLPLLILLFGCLAFGIWTWLADDDLAPVTASTAAEGTRDHGGDTTPAARAPDAAKATPDDRTNATPGTLAAPDPTTASATTGSVLVEVYRAPNLPVSDVQVAMQTQSAGRTGADGRVRLTGKPGRWPVQIAPRSLPAGLLAPIAQDTTVARDDVPGFFGREIEIVAGIETSLRLRVFLPAELTGIVVDRLGQPVADCEVRLQCRTPGLANIRFDLTTAKDGSFRFVGIPPQHYHLQTFPPAPASAPPPMPIEVVEGERSALPPIALDQGNCVLRGRVVDQDGAPMVGVKIVVIPREPQPNSRLMGPTLSDQVATATTGADGVFVCERVPAIPVRVMAHPEGSLLDFGAPHRIQIPIAAKLADPTTSAPVDLGEFVGQRSKPFRLDVTLDVDAVKCPRQPNVFVVPESTLGDENAWQRLRDVDGKYTWWCETPHEAVYVVVRSRGFAPVQRRVEVQANHTEPISVRFP